jgi:hypothetical protein
MWVLDANKAIVLNQNVAENDFSNWSEDLRAQVSGATVSTYSWNLTNAPDATSVSGSSTYDLTFTWKSFTGSPRTDTISITETPTVGNAITQTYTNETVSYSVAGEILTTLQYNIGMMPEAFGDRFELQPDPRDAGDDPVTLHGMDVMLHALGENP